MALLVDTHVHLYPGYDVSRALFSAATNFEILAAVAGIKQHIGVLALTERFDCQMFDALREGFPVAGWKINPSDDDSVLDAINQSGVQIQLVAGRQIITQERLEVLALGRNLRLQDGQPIEDVLGAIREAGALPVLPWSPGKWFFGRGRVIERLITKETAAKREFVIGDIPIRPSIWGEPRLIARGRERGVPVLAGSDPLPVPGEEGRIGSFAVLIADAPEAQSKSTALLNALAGQQRPLLGRRNGVWECLLRLMQNRQANLRQKAQ